MFTLWTDFYTLTQSYWLTCIFAVCALEPSFSRARRHKWRQRSLSPSRGWLETANEQTASTRTISRFVIIGHSYTVIWQAEWQNQVYQLWLFSIIQDPLTEEPDRSRSFCKDVQIWLFSIQWFVMIFSCLSERPAVKYFRHASCFTLRRSFWIYFLDQLFCLAQHFSIVFLFVLLALLIVLKTLVMMSRLHCS